VKPVTVLISSFLVMKAIKRECRAYASIWQQDVNFPEIP
jgi:hypothetical protein